MTLLVLRWPCHAVFGWNKMCIYETALYGKVDKLRFYSLGCGCVSLRKDTHKEIWLV